MAKKSHEMKYDDMLNNVGCPECKSIDTYERIVSVNGKDNVVACICDDCGHVMVKDEEIEE